MSSIATIEKETHGGHRTRLRERFLSGHESSRSDVAILELLLTYAIPQRDVLSLAQDLLAKFGSLEKVLAAAPADLCQIDGIKENSAVLISLVEAIRERNPAQQQATPSPPKAASAIQPGEQRVLAPLLVASTPPKPSAPAPRTAARKLQVCNGYLLEFDQLARVLDAIAQHPHQAKVERAELEEQTGLSDRQLESLVSIATAMGLIHRSKQVLTAEGALIARHDTFLDAKGTLEWCHYQGAGSPRNLVWYEIFNSILPKQQSITQDEITASLRTQLSGQYSEKTVRKHLSQEVRFVTDAYLKRNFNKLEILHQTSDQRLYRRRYANPNPLPFAAILYAHAAKQNTKLLQAEDLCRSPGSPGLLFAMDETTLRQALENLHDRELLRYERTHSLDQVRLKDDASPLSLLTAYYVAAQPQNKPPITAQGSQ
jgi:hypothetical protein